MNDVCFLQNMVRWKFKIVLILTTKWVDVTCWVDVGQLIGLLTLVPLTLGPAIHNLRDREMLQMNTAAWKAMMWEEESLCGRRQKNTSLMKAEIS